MSNFRVEALVSRLIGSHSEHTLTHPERLIMQFAQRAYDAYPHISQHHRLNLYSALYTPEKAYVQVAMAAATLVQLQYMRYRSAPEEFRAHLAESGYIRGHGSPSSIGLQVCISANPYQNGVPAEISLPALSVLLHRVEPAMYKYEIVYPVVDSTRVLKNSNALVTTYSQRVNQECVVKSELLADNTGDEESVVELNSLSTRYSFSVQFD